MLRLSYRGRSRAKTVSMPGWAFGLMAAGSAALGIALFLVVSTIAVLLLPVVLIIGGVSAFVLRKRIEKLMRDAGIGTPQKTSRTRKTSQKHPATEIEDVEYRVVQEPSRAGSRQPASDQPRT
jgi:hypothetical protein